MEISEILPSPSDVWMSADTMASTAMMLYNSSRRYRKVATVISPLGEQIDKMHVLQVGNIGGNSAAAQTWDVLSV